MPSGWASGGGPRDSWFQVDRRTTVLEVTVGRIPVAELYDYRSDGFIDETLPDRTSGRAGYGNGDYDRYGNQVRQPQTREDASPGELATIVPPASQDGQCGGRSGMDRPPLLLEAPPRPEVCCSRLSGRPIAGSTGTVPPLRRTTAP